MDEHHALIWDKVVLEQERRIVARLLGTRVRDRVRFYRKVTIDYASVVRGYFSDLAQCFKQGLKTSVLWHFKPSLSFDQWIVDRAFIRSSASSEFLSN
ncbi:hypothetical protein L6452_40076 [Arctium lappa]|uniref:Uncharacterized protein n=1 Tax=Arctium lappa TaxID=4217 RepID=A0ACB8XLH9_ARCLA|nr:hypothetical protein L6452_40076 [Arctium lappa]